MYKFYQIVVTLYSWMLFVSLWIFSTLMAAILTRDTKDKENIFNTIERLFSRIAFKLLGMKIEIQGLENIPRDEPVIFISNHQSMMDITPRAVMGEGSPAPPSAVGGALTWLLEAYMTAAG